MSAIAMLRMKSVASILGDGDVVLGERRFEVAAHFWGRGMTTGEIASMMGISRHAVSCDIKAARMRIPSLRELRGGRYVAA